MFYFMVEEKEDRFTLFKQGDERIFRQYYEKYYHALCLWVVRILSLIHISEPTRRVVISYAVFCLKKIFFNDTATTEIYTRLFVGSVRCV